MCFIVLHFFPLYYFHWYLSYLSLVMIILKKIFLCFNNFLYLFHNILRFTIIIIIIILSVNLELHCQFCFFTVIPKKQTETCIPLICPPPQQGGQSKLRLLTVNCFADERTNWTPLFNDWRVLIADVLQPERHMWGLFIVGCSLTFAHSLEKK